MRGSKDDLGKAVNITHVFIFRPDKINVNTVELEPEPAARVPGSIEVNPKTN